MELDKLPVHAKVLLEVGDRSYEGLMLPKEGDMIVIKLASGYNVGIHPKHITKSEILERPNLRTQELPILEENKDLPKLKILHTGGTIASKVDYETGGVIADFSPETLITMFPELSKIVCVESKFLGNMFSDDMRFPHMNTIAKGILEGAKEGITKFIVTSGTDFLHYLSAGLSFILANVPVSVLVVGSQRSSDRGSSDAAMNLVCATQFLATTDFQGVGVCMHASTNDDQCVILPGVNVRKMHTSRRDAFKPINTTKIALVDYANKTVVLYRKLIQITADLPESISLLKEDLKIGMIQSKPNFFAEEILAYKKFDGLILLGSGLGHFPVTKVDEFCQEHERILEALGELAQLMPVLMSAQALYGRVHMNVYAPARALQEKGILGHGSSMTPETSYMKMAWALSLANNETLPRLLLENRVGELDQIHMDEFY